MAKITHNELIDALVEKHQIGRKQASKFFNTFVSVLHQGLDQDKIVKVKGLGTFKVVDVEARESVNIQTGERLLIEGHSRLTFQPDSQMRELVNKPFSMFETVVLNEGVTFDDMPEEMQPEEQPIEQLPSEPEVTPEPAVEQIDFAVEEEAQPDPAPEPVDAPEPEIEVVEETPVDIEEVSAPEEETPVEAETPVVPETPVEADPPVEADTLVEEVPPVQEETADSEEDTPEAEEEPRRSSWKKWLLTALLVAIGIGVGYFLGKGHTPETASGSATPPAESAPAPAADAAPEDAAPVAEAPADEEEAPADDAAPEQAEADVPIWEKYNEMDARTRNGAYFITGLDYVIQAREGDNTRRISRRVYGDEEASCYIDVFNGLSSSDVIEAGTEVKIPKIELKKLVRKRIEQQNQQ